MGFFAILFASDDTRGVAVSSSNDTLLLPEGEIVNWVELILELEDGVYADYQANDLGARLCSARMRAVLEKSAGDADRLQWLPVRVNCDGQSRDYYILHFPDPRPVLDKKASIMVDDFVVKSVLSSSLLVNRRVFTHEEGGNLPLYVSDEVAERLQEEGCTGIEFVPARIRDSPC